MLPAETDDSHVHKTPHTAQVQLEALSKDEKLHDSIEVISVPRIRRKIMETQAYVNPVVPAQLDLVLFLP